MNKVSLKLENCLGIQGLKSESGVLLTATRDVAQVFGFDDPRDMLGIDDYDLAKYACQSSYVESDNVAEDFISEDELALKSGGILIFDVNIIHDEMVCMLVNKTPYRENGVTKGIYYNVMLLPNNDRRCINSFVSNPDILISKHTEKNLSICEIAPHRAYKLTKRELECIRFLIDGFSAKLIATRLGLSKRTVESYIDSIKAKLSVKKTTEIVSVALLEDFFLA